jgi:tetratricopeptide (TPR) repeat protein
LKLALPQKNLEINLQRKLVLIKDLEKDYARIAGLGSAEWGLGAIFKSAAIYRSMAQEVLEAPVPAELAGEQLETYRKEVEKSLIRPFKEKALILSQQCLDKAQEFNVLSSWTPRCYSIAAELEPGRFPKVRTLYLPPLQLAVLAPNAKSSKITVGNVKSFAYPFFSFGLFNPQGDVRSTASVSQELSVMYGQSKSLGEANAIPGSTSYRALIEERKDILNNALSSEKPNDTKKGVSFSYLNLLRLTNPGRAITMTLEAIQKDPQNNSLHNLLALAYLESGNMAAAKVTLYSLIARGVKNYSIWNNLGVISQMEGREPQAIDYFNEAMNFEDAKESVTNLVSSL